MEETGEGEPVTAASVGRVDDGEPIGPSAADEAAMVAEGEEIPQIPRDLKPAAPRSSAKLPSLDSLLARVPAATRSAIDEHLRARFVRVRKLNPGELR